MYWLLSLLAIAGVIGLLLFKRRQDAVKMAAADALARRKAPQKPAWGKRIVVPAGKPCCIAAKVLSSQPFRVDVAPLLPLAECTNKSNCECSYEPLFERRGNKERRSGMERRPNLRFDPDKLPRRNGHDRRKDKNNPFGDGAI